MEVVVRKSTRIHLDPQSAKKLDWFKSKKIRGTIRGYFDIFNGNDVFTFKITCYKCRCLVKVPNRTAAASRLQGDENNKWVILYNPPENDNPVSDYYDNNIDLKSLVEKHCPPKCPKTSLKQLSLTKINEKIQELRKEYYREKENATAAGRLYTWENDIYPKFKEWYYENIDTKDLGTNDTIRKRFDRCPPTDVLVCFTMDDDDKGRSADENVMQAEADEVYTQDVFGNNNVQAAAGEVLVCSTMDDDDNERSTDDVTKMSVAEVAEVEINHDDVNNVGVLEVTNTPMDQNQNGTQPTGVLMDIHEDESSLAAEVMSMDNNEKSTQATADVCSTMNYDSDLLEVANMCIDQNQNSTQPIDVYNNVQAAADKVVNKISKKVLDYNNNNNTNNNTNNNNTNNNNNNNNNNN